MKQYWKQFLVVFLFIIILSVGLIILGYFDYKTDAVMKIDK
jgi:preprotein translocase subunit SecE